MERERGEKCMNKYGKRGRRVKIKGGQKEKAGRRETERY